MPHPIMNLVPRLSALCGPSLVIVLMVCSSCNQDALVQRSQMDASTPAGERPPLKSSAGAVAGYPPLVLSIEPWDPPVDVGPEGQLVTTPHYLLHSTLEDGWLSEKIPAFLETALLHYRTAITDLPVPNEPLKTYVLGERRQWQAFTRMILPGESGLYLSLGKGGYTTEGLAVLYDIGRWDTLCITAHEGWHQYCQNNFKEMLPAWIDEGIATYMEGCRFDRSSEVATFLPWRNFERFNELRNCYRRGMMYPLFDIISRSPQYFLEQGQEHLLSYYAQVWVLTQYLMEGEGGPLSPRSRTHASRCPEGHPWQDASRVATSRGDSQASTNVTRHAWARSRHGLLRHHHRGTRRGLPGFHRTGRRSREWQQHLARAFPGAGTRGSRPTGHAQPGLGLVLCLRHGRQRLDQSGRPLTDRSQHRKFFSDRGRDSPGIFLMKHARARIAPEVHHHVEGCLVPRAGHQSSFLHVESFFDVFIGVEGVDVGGLEGPEKAWGAPARFVRDGQPTFSHGGWSVVVKQSGAGADRGGTTTVHGGHIDVRAVGEVRGGHEFISKTLWRNST